MAVRVAFADSDCQCSMLLYHDLLTAVLQNKNQPLPDPLADTTEVRTALRDVLRSTQWLCKLTFRENDYQQVLELDCKHLEPFLEPQKPVEDFARFMQVLPRCALGKGCPVASLDVLNVDNELGILRAGQLDASAARVLIAFNEALQQDPQSASAMRVKRSFDCLLAPLEGEVTVRAWLKRGQRAQPDLAPGSGSAGSLEWSELPDGWRVTVCCRSCEYRMSAKVRPWWESHRHVKLCGWTLSSDAYWYCRDHTQLAASVTFEDRLLARDPLLRRRFYQKSLAHAKKG